jgi:hypothetical protein
MRRLKPLVTAAVVASTTNAATKLAGNAPVSSVAPTTLYEPNRRCPTS